MVEAMYEQSPEFFQKFLKNFNLFILSNEPDISQVPLNTNFAFATHSTQNESCTQLLDNDHPHIHVLIELTKECVDVVNQLTSTTFVVPVNYNNSINTSTDIGGAPLRRRLPHVFFALQTRSI